MLAFSAVGDAIGGGHETTGLSDPHGVVAAADAFPSGPDEWRLRKLSDYDGRTTATAFGVWADPAGPLKDAIGIVTDDASVKLSIVAQWRASAPDAELDEAAFKAWIKAEIAAFVRPTGSSAVETAALTRNAALRSLNVMYEGFKTWSNLPADQREGFEVKATAPDEQVFWKPGDPVVIGAFLFLDLAAQYADRTPKAVHNRFAALSELDQGTSSAYSGMMAYLLHRAINSAPGDDFSAFIKTGVEAFAASGLGDDNARATLVKAFNDGWSLGRARRDRTLREMAVAIQTEIYAKRTRIRSGFDKYDPAIFLKQMGAALGYGGADLSKAVHALALGVGDADTIPAQVCSIAGGYFGRALLDRRPGLAAAMATTINVTERFLSDGSASRDTISMPAVVRALSRRI